MGEDMSQNMMSQFRMKLTPGPQEGEIPGSWHDVMMKLMPNMKMDPHSMGPGKTPHKMVDAMLEGWRTKYGDLPDVEDSPKQQEPTRLSAAGRTVP
jgi:hypothetical protein